MKEAINYIFDNGMSEFTAKYPATGISLSLGIMGTLIGFAALMAAMPVAMLGAGAVAGVIGYGGFATCMGGMALGVGSVFVHDMIALGKGIASLFRGKRDEGDNHDRDDIRSNFAPRGPEFKLKNSFMSRHFSAAARDRTNSGIPVDRARPRGPGFFSPFSDTHV